MISVASMSKWPRAAGWCVKCANLGQKYPGAVICPV
jgi:hypothetical protein